MTTEIQKIETSNSNLSNLGVIFLAMIIIFCVVVFGQKFFVNNNANQKQMGLRQEAAVPSAPDFVINAEVNTGTKTSK